MINYGYNPLLTPTGLGLGLLCQRIKRDKNKVLLTGVGGDELFCGYYVIFCLICCRLKSLSIQRKILFLEKNIKKFIRSPELKDINEAGKLKNKNRLNFFQEGQTILNNYIKNYKKLKLKNFIRMFFITTCYKIFICRVCPLNFFNLIMFACISQ